MSEKFDFDASKEAWRKLNIEEESRIPLYMKDWYWDAVCDDEKDWMVVCNYSDDGIEAAFPFLYTKRKGMWFIELPWQVSAAGIWFRQDYRDKGTEKALLYLKKQITEIVNKLPRYDCLKIRFNSELWTWHPFYWLDFEATPQYTSLLSNQRLNESGDVQTIISKRRRRDLNKAKTKYHIEVGNCTVEEYWNFFLQTYKARKSEVSYSEAKFMKLIYALEEHDACEIRTVLNEENEMVAANITLCDHERVYDQFFTYMPGMGEDAQTFATYDCITQTLQQGKIFDFEGSMIPGVCELYSSWNPAFEIQYVIEKYSKKYKILDMIRNIFRE